VHYTHVTDEITTVLLDDHELTLPELLIVGNLVVVALAFAHFEAAGVSLEGEGEILELFSVH